MRLTFFSKQTLILWGWKRSITFCYITTPRNVVLKIHSTYALRGVFYRIKGHLYSAKASHINSSCVNIRRHIYTILTNEFNMCGARLAGSCERVDRMSDSLL